MRCFIRTSVSAVQNGKDVLHYLVWNYKYKLLPNDDLCFPFKNKETDFRKRQNKESGLTPKLLFPTHLHPSGKRDLLSSFDLGTLLQCAHPSPIISHIPILSSSPFPCLGQPWNLPVNYFSYYQFFKPEVTRTWHRRSFSSVIPHWTLIIFAVQ